MVTTDLNGKPFQLTFVRSSQMMIFARVICDPPLGQTTVIPYDQDHATFTVLIESSKSFPVQGWEAVLWHNGHGDQEWRELQLEDVTTDAKPLCISSKDRSRVYRRYFNGRIQRPNKTSLPVHFTLKYRTSSSESWKWMNDFYSLRDGELYFQANDLPDKLDDLLKDYDPSLPVHPVDTEVPETHLWSLAAAIDPAHDKHSHYSEISLGFPTNFTRWFALVRIWTPWLAPRHGQGMFAPTEDAVLCSFLRRDGLHLVMLAVSGVDDVLTVFKPNGEGKVMISARNDGLSQGHARVIIAVGKTFETANAAVMYHARKLVKGEEYMSGEMKAEMKASIDGGVKPEWLENWYDGLTYCTWNGLGQNLTEEMIYLALDILGSNHIRITNLIIDDNWQSLDNKGASQMKRGWTDFDANKEGFPKGLKHTVTTIRQKHTDIQHIAVWHALLGYWGGISPEGSIAKKYKTKEVRKQGDVAGGSMTVVDADDAQKLYDDFYKFLASTGIDSVKTDAQFFLDLLEDANDRRHFIKAYQDAWTISSLRYFSIKCISCMSQTPQILFHSQLPTNKPRLMVRNSDDFFPEIPTSHPWHIFCNAHNALFTAHLNVLPDWDMFQTSHPYSSFHAAARCVSGGPIYFTDVPGEHDVELIKAMTAQTTNDKTRILRPSTIGKATGVYTAYEEERFLKVGTYHGSKGKGVGILGIFNVSERLLSEFVALHEFPGVEKETNYVVRAHNTGEVSIPMRKDGFMALASLQIDVKGWEILSSYPLQKFNLSSDRSNKREATEIGVLGLLGKMTGAAAVTNTDLHVEKNGRLRIWTSLKALGLLGVYISDLKMRSIEKDFLIMILGRAIPLHTVNVSSVSDCVLEVDVEKAWKELELDSGWSNEVALEIFIQNRTFD